MKKINCKNWCLAASLVCSVGVASTASAATLFSDDFQGALSQWNPVGSAVIVSDPLVQGGSALAFNSPKGGGDIFSATSFSSSTNNNFVLSYDYLGLGAGGGYVGIRSPGETWLSGDGSYPTPFSNPDTGSWQHVSFSFSSASAVRLELEQWNGRNGTPRQALFKNLVLTDTNGVSVAAVPEPHTYAMLLAGLGAIGFIARRRRTV